MKNEQLMCGVVGTIISATGTSLSVNDVQAIVSIVVTSLGFFLSVLLPLIIKLIKKIKKALEDKKLSKEEIDDIVETGVEIIDTTTTFIDSQKKEDKTND